jgi:hypothetical protein
MLRRLKNIKAICKSCGIVHLGRHPNSCMCENCLKLKGRLKLSDKHKGKELINSGLQKVNL